MALLDPGQRLEPLGHLVESLVTGGAGESGGHLRVLVGLPFDGRLEVVLGRPDRDAGHRVADLTEEVEVTEGVAGLPFGHRAEEGGDIRVALDVGLLGEVEIATVGLALAGKRLLEISLRLAVFQCGHGVPFMVVTGSWGWVATAVTAAGRPVVSGIRWRPGPASAGARSRVGIRGRAPGRRSPPSPLRNR